MANKSEDTPPNGVDDKPEPTEATRATMENCRCDCASMMARFSKNQSKETAEGKPEGKPEGKNQCC